MCNWIMVCWIHKSCLKCSRRCVRRHHRRSLYHLVHHFRGCSPVVHLPATYHWCSSECFVGNKISYRIVKIRLNYTLQSRNSDVICKMSSILTVMNYLQKLSFKLSKCNVSIRYNNIMNRGGKDNQNNANKDLYINGMTLSVPDRWKNKIYDSKLRMMYFNSNSECTMMKARSRKLFHFFCDRIHDRSARLTSIRVRVRNLEAIDSVRSVFDWL